MVLCVGDVGVTGHGSVLHPKEEESGKEVNPGKQGDVVFVSSRRTPWCKAGGEGEEKG